MKKHISILFLFLSLFFLGQSKITVLKTGERSPIPNASVFCKGKTLGKTNNEGTLTFKTKCKRVDIKANGFYEDEAVVDKIMEIGLSKIDPKTQSIEAIIIADKSDPRALAILQKVNDNFKNNSPHSLDSYSFKSYEKISFDFDEDSIKQYNQYLMHRLDSLKLVSTAVQSAEKKKDSLENLNVMKLMTTSKLFLWERASEFLYSKKYGEKVNILDNRVAGLKQPVYEMLALRSNRNKIPKEIQEENRTLYRYFLTDSIDIDGRKNYVIRFRQADYKNPIQRRKFNGYLYVDAATYGLKKIESNSKKKSEGSITSIWKPIDNKWFLLKENFKIKMGSTVFDEKKSDKKKDDSDEKLKQKFGNYVFVMADYFDFKTSIDENKKDFSGYSMSVENSDGDILEKYRTDSLTTRERMTYTKIDSVGKKYNLDQKLNVLTGFLKGKIRVGNVDFDALQLLKYNQYEGFRLGIGVKMNEKFNKYISPDAYIAYGFKDSGWKYGAGIDFKTTLKKTSYFRAEYYNDVDAAGRFNENLWNFKMKINNSGVDLNNDRFYHFEGFKVSYENDLSNALTLRVSAKRDQEEAKFDYNYNNLGNSFENFATQLTLKYSPNSKSMMTPSGKLTYEQNYPEFYFNYEQGLKTFGGDFDFSRFDFLVQHSFKTKIGVTGVRLYTGLVTGNAPIWHQYAINGLGNGGSSLNFNLTSYLGFATMEGGKYYNDKFVGYYLTHRVPFYFSTFGKKISSFDMVYRGITGDMKNTAIHDFEFEKLNHFYQEIGLEANNFLGSPFNLGFFYRVGYYATSTFKENFAIQLKLNFLGF
ncbi:MULTISPECIES: DUF5686 family protein [unclassified Kaistella]|uniref:DUF5686 family protein n=1 Tax=unclassified Kaistella TaxID=2762626 RepID=UPI0027337937|nr:MULTISPECIES: DUF5686 family protein [unclassified Kaistella]MDP2454045.1 DUF5686 family protein [Kaistella sp. SH11-4b]MDP2457102.1 DUF5686 family protein [Kaistella sp. SH40-3]MDP2459860.1 DUF5686 family protein [Kaistella sp. SH19-2b]